MPVLPKEPSLWPEDLLDAVPETPPADQRWWVLHTRPRAEKTFVRQIQGKFISFYLPLHPKTNRSGKRENTSYLPLFPSYVFLLGNDDDRLRALKTNQIVQCLEVADQQELWQDLVRLRGLVESGLPLTPEERIVPGMEAEIIAGPLAGYRGTVVRRKNSAKFMVAVHFLQRGASVEVDQALIQPVA